MMPSQAHRDWLRATGQLPDPEKEKPPKQKEKEPGPQLPYQDKPLTEWELDNLPGDV